MPAIRFFACAALLTAALVPLACGSDGDDTAQRQEVSDAIGDLEASVDAAAEVDREPTAQDIVRNYFRLLNHGDYEKAWTFLAPSVREQFGGFEAWVGGYETTQSTRITSLKQTSAFPRSVDLQVEIEAVDSGPCDQALVRGFAGPWSLGEEASGWIIVSASFEQVSGTTTSAACGEGAPVYYTDAAYQVAEEPGQIQVDNHDVLTGLSWQSWGGAQASGIGTLNHRICDPHCAGGYDVQLSASVTLSEIVDCGGRRQYRSLTITASGDVPSDFPNPLAVPNFGGC